MGRRPGHLFHPAEAAGRGILFGHGPVFRDFNFEKDRAAAILVLTQRLPTTLVPYGAARRWELSGSDLDRMKAGGAAAAWVASRAAGWLDYWRAEVGRDGFYPFDLLAGAYVLDHRSFTCAEASAWVAPDRRLWHWLPGPVSLLVGLEAEVPRDALARTPVVYCLRAGDRTPGSVMERLARGPPSTVRPVPPQLRDQVPAARALGLARTRVADLLNLTLRAPGCKRRSSSWSWSAVASASLKRGLRGIPGEICSR